MDNNNNTAGNGNSNNANNAGNNNGGQGDNQNKNNENKNNSQENNNDNQPKTFTQEDVDKILSERLDRESKKFEKTLTDKLNAAQKDWEEKSKLSEDERAKALQKEKEDSLTSRQNELDLRENRIFAKEKLNGLGITVSERILNTLVTTDQDGTTENIEAFVKDFNSAVEAGVQAKLKGKTPPDPSNNGGNNQQKKVTGRYI